MKFGSVSGDIFDLFIISCAFEYRKGAADVRLTRCYAIWFVVIGSKQAVIRLKAKYSNTCVVILFHLVAAIRGVEMKQLEDTCKAELKVYFKQL